MLAYCTCLAIIVTRIHAATDGVSDGDRDVTDQYIDNVQQQWKQYRNLVKDGFIYNDSFLVINDYEEILRKGFKNKNLNVILRRTRPIGLIDAIELHS